MDPRVGRRGAGRVPGPAGTALGCCGPAGFACSAQPGTSWTATSACLPPARGGSVRWFRGGRGQDGHRRDCGHSRRVSAGLPQTGSDFPGLRSCGKSLGYVLIWTPHNYAIAPVGKLTHGAVSTGWVHQSRGLFPPSVETGARAVRADVSWTPREDALRGDCRHPWASATPSLAVRAKAPVVQRVFSIFPCREGERVMMGGRVGSHSDCAGGAPRAWTGASWKCIPPHPAASALPLRCDVSTWKDLSRSQS